MSKASYVFLSLLAVGAAFTWFDYQSWHHAEFDRFGQGQAAQVTLLPSQPLGLAMTHRWGQFRIKFPVNWTVVANPKNEIAGGPLPTWPAGRHQLWTVADSLGQAHLTVWFEPTKLNLPDFATREAVNLVREREYIGPITLLTWEGDPMIQKGLIAGKQGVVVIEATCAASWWPTYAQTFASVYQSVEWF